MLFGCLVVIFGFSISLQTCFVTINAYLVIPSLLWSHSLDVTQCFLQKNCVTSKE